MNRLENFDSRMHNPDWMTGVWRSVDVDGHEWKYREWGNPDAKLQFVLAHGYGGSAEGLDQLSSALVGNIPYSDGFVEFRKKNPEAAYSMAEFITSFDCHVVVPALPAFGVTKPDGRKSTLDYAEGLVAFVKTLEIENPYLVGTSWGGKIVVAAAALHPELDVEAVFLEQTTTKEDELMPLANKINQIINKPIISDVLKFGKIGNALALGLLIAGQDYWKSSSKNKRLIRESLWRSHSKVVFPIAKEIPQDIGEYIGKFSRPAIIIGATEAQLTPVLKSAESAVRFHPEIADPSEKIRRAEVFFWPVIGGHGMVNDIPEGVAAIIYQSIELINHKNAGVTRS